MTEITFNSPIIGLKQLNQLDLLFEINKLRIVRKKLTTKLKSLEKLLKSGRTSQIGYKFEALKVIVTENDTQLKNLLVKVDSNSNLFDLTKNLKENELYIQNLKKERKKKRIDLKTFELTKAHYLQKILDIQDSIKQLKVSASTYSLELRDELIMLEDQRIRLVTEKMRREITKEEFEKNNKEIENLKKKIEEKLAFLKVRILDYEFD